MKFAFPCALGLCLSTGAAHATPLSQTQDQPLIVVTANRYAQAAEDVLASHSVISRADLVALQAQDIAEVLALQAGIEVSRNGGPGTATSVFMRGSNSDHVLVLIDGARVGSAITGAYAWENLPLNQVERIEIIRGPRAAFYGSDALGGVIQIFTRRGEGVRGAYTIGSRDTHRFEAALNRRSESDSHWGVSVGSRKTDGFSATAPGHFSHDPDDDGFEALSLNAHYSRAFDRSEVRLNFLAGRQDVDFDQGNTDARDHLLSLRWMHEVSADWQGQLSVQHGREVLETAVFASRFNSRRTQLAWQMHGRWRGQDLAWGVEHRRERGLIPHDDDLPGQLFIDDDARNNAVFGSWQHNRGDHHWLVSARRDHSQAHGGVFTGHLAWALQSSASRRWMLSYGSAFKAPNLSELYYRSTEQPGFIIGNPDLQAETSHSAEISHRWQTRQHRFEAALYSNRIRGLISFTTLPSGVGSFINIDRARIHGLELSHQWHSNAWTWASQVTWQRPQQLLPDGGHTDLLRRARRHLSTRVWRRFEAFSVGAQWQHSSDRTDLGGVRLDAYNQLDATADWTLGAHWRVALKAVNLNNSDHRLADGYNVTPRSLFLTFEWQD